MKIFCICGGCEESVMLDTSWPCFDRLYVYMRVYICANIKFINFFTDTDEPDVEKRPFITYDMLQNNFQAFLRKSKSNVDRTDPDEGEFVSTLDKM